MRKEITVDQARRLIKELNLTSGDSFSNTEPSDLCYEYRMETGYWLSNGKNHLVHLSTTKDEKGELQTKAVLKINTQSLGIDEDEATQEDLNVRFYAVKLIIESIIGEEIKEEDFPKIQ